MSTPYSTPSFPAAPRPTPASSRAHKAPIYNPYDKFTQNEFDTWIGGITGALRRALGQEGDEEEQESITRDVAADLFASRDDDEAEESPEYEPAEASEAEGSFEEATTRLDKGKGRDPREGPGLGGRHQPIEILYSDSDEEESEGEEEIGDDEVNEEGEYDWREYDSDENRHDEYEGSSDEYGEEASGHRDKDDSPEIIELSSEGEEEEGEGENQEPFDGDVSDSPGAKARYTPSAAKFEQPPSPQDEDENVVGDEQEEYSQKQDEVDEQAFPPRRSQSKSLDLADPWVGPQTYAEDFYSGGDIPEGVLNPALVSPSNLTPVRAQSEHPWEDDATGLLLGVPPGAWNEPSVIDVDMDEDEKDEDLLNESSSVISSPTEEYNSHQRGYVGKEGEYDENHEFRDDQAFDQFLGEEAGDERHTDADSVTSPKIFIATQPQTTQTGTTSLVAYDRFPSATPVPNGHVDWNPPAFPVGNDTPEAAAKSPASGAPDIIELSDDDDDDEGDSGHGNDHDHDKKDNVEEEVEELISEDEEPTSTTSDLIKDFISEGDEDVITTQEIRGEDIGHSDDAAILEPFVFELEEVVGVQTHNSDGEISAEGESALRDVENGPEVINVDDFEEGAAEEMHEVPADVRFKASLLESFLASADTTVEPVWHGGAPGLLTNLEQTSVFNDATVQSNGSGDSIVPSVVAAFSEEFAFAIGDASAEPPTENLSNDKAACSTSPQLSQEGPDVLQESNKSNTAEVLRQVGVHYTVSEVMTDDGRPSTVPPDDRDADVVSVADDQAGGSVPYIVEEPESEGRLTEAPIDQDAIVDVSMDSSRLSDEDDGSISPIANHTPNFTMAETTPIAPDEIRSNPQNLPGATPATAGIADFLAPELPQTDELPVLGWEERDDEARTPYAFPMPISANPSVLDPAGISCTPDTHGTPPDLLRGLVAPQDSAQALHDSTEHSVETSLTKPSIPMITSVEQQSLLNISTPQHEAALMPVSPGPHADATDNALTSAAEPELLTPPSAKYSSVPFEIRDGADNSNDEALDVDTAGAASAQFRHPVLPSDEAKPLHAIEDEDDPFKLMGSDSKVAPGAVDDRPGSSEDQDERSNDVQLSLEIPDEEAISTHQIINGTGTQVDKDQVATVTATSFYQNGASHFSNGSRQNNNVDSIKDQQKKASKRKRTAPPGIPIRLTRSMSSKISPVIDRKGKAKAEEATPSENGSSSSGASVASKMLRGASHDTSRASSVVSTAHSVESSAFSMQQSPTLARQSSNFKPDPPVLYHVHSGIHHHHSRPSTVQRPSQTQKHPVASSSQSADALAQSSPSHPSPSQRTAVTHSPVTRSNCRFHRISLPREEGGPRVSFIVPGCSLGDRALMEEEDIHDEGDATTLDHARMVGDIETLDFSSDLVGILRQLVGVDLLRENEIFFLPQPGDSYRRKRHGKSKLYAARPSSGDFATALVFQNVASSPREPKPRKISPSPSLVQAPVSVAGSASTSADSTGWKGRKSDRHSPSTAPYSDDEMTMREGDGASKRRKGSSAKRNGVASSEEMPPPSSDPQSKHAFAQRHVKARRSKRLSLDAHAYKPEDDAEEASTDQDSDATKGQRKKTGKRGIKRNRTSELVEAEAGLEQPMVKRLRARPSTSSNSGR